MAPIAVPRGPPSTSGYRNPFTQRTTRVHDMSPSRHDYGCDDDDDDEDEDYDDEDYDDDDDEELDEWYDWGNDAATHDDDAD